MRRTKSNLRIFKSSHATVALLAFACLALAVAFTGTRARAQQPANQNGQSQAPRTKRITPLKTSDGAQGSRVTITSDGELNDYSAYRSGDRFIVVIPQAQGGGGEGARGRGFDGAQVTRRGNDLVYTFKLAPGASARVNQRFNRLDVQFSAPAQTNANTAAQPAATPRTGVETSGIKPNQTTGAQQQTTTNSRTNPTTATGQSSVSVPNANSTATTTTPNTTTNPNGTQATNPTEVSPSLSLPTTTTPVASPSVEASVTPQVAASATPEQIAQAQPAQSAPVNVVSRAPGSGEAFGTVIGRNFPLILGGMMLVGLFILFVAKFGGRTSSDALPPVAETAALESHADATEGAALEPATINGATTGVASPLSEAASTPTGVAAATTAAVVASTTSAPKKGKQRKEERRREKREKAEADARLAEAAAMHTTEAAAPNAAAANAQIEPAATTETIQSATPATSTNVASPAASNASSDAATLLAEAALVAAPIVAAGTIAHDAKSDAKSEEERSAKSGASLESVSAAQSSVEPAAPVADMETVGEEIRKLLVGEPYDESLVGAKDAGTRELVSSELAASLATRQVERKARARAAFMRHGYFDDATRHLQSAEAPGQRASAAHVLSLLGDRIATPHLVAALEDPSAEVRRTSVEALAELRDPSALEPLEALRWRETSRQVPRSTIMRAIEACTPVVAVEIEQTRAQDAEQIESAKSATEPSAPRRIETTTTATTGVEATTTETTEAQIESPARIETPSLEASDVEASDVEASDVEAVIASPAVGLVAQEMHATAEASTVAPLAVESAGTVAPFESDEAIESVGSVEPVQPVESPVHAAPEVAVADEARAANELKGEADESKSVDDWLDLGVEEHHVSTVGEETLAQESQPSAGDVSSPAFEWSLDADETPTLAAEAASHAEPLSFEFSPSAEAPTSGESLASDEPLLEMPPASDAQTFEHAAIEEPPTVETAPTASTAPTATVATVDELVAEAAVSAPVEKGLEIVAPTPAPQEKGLEIIGASDAGLSGVEKSIQLRLNSEDVGERAASIRALARLSTGEAFQQICSAFDDPSPDVRNAAARALYDTTEDRAETFTRALRESSPERRRNIGASLSSSGLADEAVSHLTGESRERTYDAFSLLFLMAKAGETAPLIRAIETHPDTEVRLAVVKLLALSGQHEVLPSFKRLAVRGSLPAEVRSAVMEAIYQISSAGAQPTRS